MSIWMWRGSSQLSGDLQRALTDFGYGCYLSAFGFSSIERLGFYFCKVYFKKVEIIAMRWELPFRVKYAIINEKLPKWKGNAP